MLEVVTGNWFSSGPIQVVDEYFDAVLLNCYDAIGIMLMIRIIHQHQVLPYDGTASSIDISISFLGINLRTMVFYSQCGCDLWAIIFGTNCTIFCLHQQQLANQVVGLLQKCDTCNFINYVIGLLQKCDINSPIRFFSSVGWNLEAISFDPVSAISLQKNYVLLNHLVASCVGFLLNWLQSTNFFASFCFFTFLKSKQ